MWLFFLLWYNLSQMTQNSDHPRDYWWNSWANLGDWWISAKSTAEQLGISRERVGSIIHEDLDTWKLCAKWILKCLSADRKSQWCQSSEQLLEFFRCDPNDFLSRLVTMDETCLYHYDPETKQQSMERQHSSSPRPKIFRVQKSAGRVLTSIFWDQDGILLIDIFQRVQLSKQSITHLCWWIEGHFEGKMPRKTTKGVLFLHDNALANQALANQKKLAYLGFQCLDHPPYSPNLVPSDYHLFPGLEKQLKGCHFSSHAEVIAATET